MSSIAIWWNSTASHLSIGSWRRFIGLLGCCLCCSWFPTGLWNREQRGEQQGDATMDSKPSYLQTARDNGPERFQMPVEKRPPYAWVTNLIKGERWPTSWSDLSDIKSCRTRTRIEQRHLRAFELVKLDANLPEVVCILETICNHVLLEDRWNEAIKAVNILKNRPDDPNVGEELLSTLQKHVELASLPEPVRSS